LTCASQAQLAAGPGIADSTSGQPVSSRTFAFSGSIPGQLDGALSVTFSIYSDQQSATALWTETQVVQITAEKYSVMLGSTSATGVPSEIFSADQSHWLGVQVNGAEKRYLLVSVPYAMKAVNADQLGGLPFSEYVTAQQLQAALQSAAAPGTSTSPNTTSTGPIGQAAAAGTPPQPATDFTDNNASEVLLVTQQGTGYAIHAVSSAQPEAIFSENSSLGGTALRGFSSNPSGQSIGLLAEVASPDGISALLNNRAGGKILSLRSNGAEVGSFDSQGNLTANGVNASNVNAQSFFGNGFGLSNVPPSAVGAQSFNFPGAIVQRDGNGNFSAGQISAQNFIGSGFGLTNVPPLAVGAQTVNFPGAIVQRDGNGNFSAGQISAQNFIGSGFGLINVPPLAVGAQTVNFPGAIVQRDGNGDFSAGQISAQNFIGNGFGLTNVPPLAVGAQTVNFPGAIVQRDGSGSFSAGGLNLTGIADFTAAASTAPVKAVLSINTPTSCVASKELLIKTDALPGQQLFICNAAGNGYLLVGDGTAAGVTSIAAGDASINVGGTATAPTIAVADGSITATKLAPNAVTSSIADGSLSPAKITGTAATLGNNSFNGTQTMSGLNVNGFVNLQGFSNSFISSSNSSGTAMQVQGGSVTNAALAANGSFNAISANSNSGYGVFATSGVGTGLHGDGATMGVEAQTGSGVALSATVNNFGGATGTAGVFTHSGTGKILSGRSGSPATEVFSVDASGNLLANGNFSSFGALTTQYPNSTIGTLLNSLVKLTPNGLAVSTSAGDGGGAIGLAVAGAGTTGNVQIAYSGRAMCQFDNTPVAGDYAGISRTQAGMCVDLGQSIPISSGQIIGRIISPPPGVVTGLRIGQVLLFNSESRGGTVSVINTGAGLIGGPITSSGFISIASNGVTNAMLQNSSVNVIPGAGLAGGGPVSLGGTVTLNNTGALSFNGRTGNVAAAPGDYSFAQIAGTAGASQLPATTVYNNQSNTFNGDQTINGNLTAASVVARGNSTPLSAVLTVNDTSGQAGNQPAFFAGSFNNPAAVFFSGSGTILSAGTSTHNVLGVTGAGMDVIGTVTATSFAGDGSALTNVTASKIGTLAQADIATNAALSAETTARQSDVANVQASIGAESAARQSVEASLLSSISAETTARQSDVSTLQTNINNVSAADAKLAASNTFTAGTQDFSGAGATLPVRSVLTANTPTACVASKELLIKTDAPAGQQLFLCDATGRTWNLVGDGAANGVSSFNGRNGSVSPASGDYSFAQISGSAAASQLPAAVVYSNQSNTFTGNQTVNGGVTATSFSGSGSSLTGVNAASLNGIPSNAFAQLHAINTFTSEQAFAASTAVNPSLNIPAGVAPATPLAGDVWNTSGVLQYRDNASTTRSLVSTTQSGGLQLLKLTASITPTNIAVQSCTEQSFTVSGITTGDTLLSVSQPSTSSPGTNIAISGFRVPAANTVAIQFCNVSRNNNSTPTSGVYTFALMR
jgi:hypothetical protein